MSGRRRRTRGNVRRKGPGWEAYVRLHAGAGGFWSRRYPRSTPREVMQRDIDHAVARYRQAHPMTEAGTLARDVQTYLALLVDRPPLQRARAWHLAWWVRRFGSRARWSLTPAELETYLRERLADGYSASDVRHHRTALSHLYTKLDGRAAPNPLREVPAPAPPPLEPRAIPMPLVDAIFAWMPDRHYAGGAKLTSAQAATIRAALTRDDANASALARAYRVSETLIRRIGRQATDQRDAPGKTKARLQVLAYVGLPPAQMARLRPTDLDWGAHPAVFVPARRKGHGTRPTRLPVTARGAAALQAFHHADAYGRYSTSSARQLFRRAIDRFCRALEAHPETAAQGRLIRQQLATARPYDLRHSYLSHVYQTTGDIKATQALALHADRRTTDRYTLAAVDARLQTVVAQIDVVDAANLAANFSATTRATRHQNPPVCVEWDPRRSPAKIGAKGPGDSGK